MRDRSVLLTADRKYGLVPNPSRPYIYATADCQVSVRDAGREGRVSVDFLKCEENMSPDEPDKGSPGRALPSVSPGGSLNVKVGGNAGENPPVRDWADVGMTAVRNITQRLRLPQVNALPGRAAHMTLTDNLQQATRLHSAVQAGDGDAVRQLLIDGADRNATDIWGGTALHQAVRTGKVSIVEMLLDPRGFQDVVNGNFVNARNDNGNTALHIAAMHGRVVVVEILLNFGALATAVNKKGATALSLARDLKRQSVVDMLQEREAQRQNFNPETPQWLSSGCGGAAVLPPLTLPGNLPSGKPLQQAARRGIGLSDPIEPGR